MSRGFKYALLVALFLLLASIPLAMQFETGVIEGTIVDDQGAVAKASVEARDVMNGVIGFAESDATGFYKVENLRAGRYSLWVEAADHESAWIYDITVGHAQAVKRDVVLVRTHPRFTGPTGISTESPSRPDSR